MLLAEDWATLLITGVRFPIWPPSSLEAKGDRDLGVLNVEDPGLGGSPLEPELIIVRQGQNAIEGGAVLRETRQTLENAGVGTRSDMCISYCGPLARVAVPM